MKRAVRISNSNQADADLLREMIGFAAEKLMALEVGAKTGAGYGERAAQCRGCPKVAPQLLNSRRNAAHGKRIDTERPRCT